MVGVAGDAGDDLGIARLHRARRAPQRHHPARPAHGDVVEPARREPEVLHEAHRGVGEQQEPGHAHAVDLVLGEARALEQRGQRARDEPVGALDRVAHVRHGHWHRDRHARVAGARAHEASRRLRARRSRHSRRSSSARASSLSSLRCTFSVGVSGSARCRRRCSPGPCSMRAARGTGREVPRRGARGPRSRPWARCRRTPHRRAVRPRPR